MIPGERLLGYDARNADPDSTWGQERKAIFLLRLDVDRPLSADRLVWPAVLPIATVSSAQLPTATLGLWPRFMNLCRELEVTPETMLAPFQVVAITVVTYGMSREERKLWRPVLTAIPHLRRGKGWFFLGYDIADMALLSGLSNCGYDQAEVEALRANWGSRLNNHHLLDSLSQAFEFRDLSNKRVPEHAPFFIYGLYAVKAKQSVMLARG